MIQERRTEGQAVRHRRGLGIAERSGHERTREIHGRHGALDRDLRRRGREHARGAVRYECARIDVGGRIEGAFGIGERIGT